MEKILPFKGTRAPAKSIPNLGRNRAGQKVSNGEATLRFDKDGFPEFETQFEVLLDNSHFGSGRRDLHIRASNRKLFDAIQQDPGLASSLKLGREHVDRLPSSSTPPHGYIWHHHQDAGRMQLITQEAHSLSIPHTGGMAIWGGGY